MSRDKRYLALVKLAHHDGPGHLPARLQEQRDDHITKHTGTVNNSRRIHAGQQGGSSSPPTAGGSTPRSSLTRSDGTADHRLRAALGHPRRRLFEGRQVPDRRRQRGLATRRPPARRGHAETGRAAGDAARPGAEASRSRADESAIAFYASDGSAPDDLWAGDVGEPPRRLTDALNPTSAARTWWCHRSCASRSYDSLEIPGLLYEPHQARPRAKAPALVLVHGGPGGQAQVGLLRADQALVNHGYVVFDINNRGSSGYGKTFYAMDDRKHGEADLGDVVASKRMLVRRGTWTRPGSASSGGATADTWCSPRSPSGPTRSRRGWTSSGSPTGCGRSPASRPGGPRSGRRSSPRWATRRPTGPAAPHLAALQRRASITAPLIVLQGANDPRVLKVESDEIVAAVKKNGVPVEYIVFDDEGHGFVKKENEIRGTGRR